MSKPNIILDIDNTLISSEDYENINNIVGDMNLHHFEHEIIIERPYLKEFLKFVFSNFNVYFSTRMTKDRCDFILNEILDSKQRPLDVLTREDCLTHQAAYSSPEELKKSFPFDCIWIDDSPQYILLDDNFNQEVIKIDFFDGDIVDCELKNLISLLKTKLN